MASRRMLDKKISVSEQVANLEREAQLIFTWSIPHADDLGLLPSALKTLRAMVVPMLDIRQADFDKHITNIINAGLMEYYEYKNKTFLRLTNFFNFQILRKDRNPQTLIGDIQTWEEAEKLGFITKDLRTLYTGEDHHNWKGGKKTENEKVRSSRKYTVWRLSVFERDNFTCQNQKCNKRGGKLEAHHIKNFSEYPDLRFEVSNGITYCEDCHEEIEKALNKAKKEKDGMSTGNNGMSTGNNGSHSIVEDSVVECSIEKKKSTTYSGEKNFPPEKEKISIFSQENKIKKTSTKGPDPEIEKCISFLKEFLGGTLDGTIVENRQYCFLLLEKIKKDYPQEDPVILIKLLIVKGIEKDPFIGKNITNFRYLYYNTQKIILSIKLADMITQKNKKGGCANLDDFLKNNPKT